MRLSRGLAILKPPRRSKRATRRSKERFRRIRPISRDYLAALDDDAAHRLFAHCAGLTINAVHDPVVRGPGKREHALRLATALNLDMSEQGFVAEAPNFFGRVTKATILASVAEAKGEETANLLADLKKKEMAAEATRLVAGIRWLPEPLRTPAAIDEEGAAALPQFWRRPNSTAARAYTNIEIRSERASSSPAGNACSQLEMPL